MELLFPATTLVKDRVLLIGDAANLGDPISGGGIHMAMESAHVAASVVLDALRRNDASARFARPVRKSLEPIQRARLARRRSVPHHRQELRLREFWLHVLKMIAAMAKHDDSFRQFAAGIFSGAAQARNAFSRPCAGRWPPMDPRVWMRAGAPVPKRYWPREERWRVRFPPPAGRSKS